jgi:hypothetical protein
MLLPLRIFEYRSANGGKLWRTANAVLFNGHACGANQGDDHVHAAKLCADGRECGPFLGETFMLMKMMVVSMIMEMNVLRRLMSMIMLMASHVGKKDAH